MIELATSALLKMAYSSIAASVSVAVVFALAVLGAARSGDARRAHRTAAAVAYTVLAIVGLACSAAIVVYAMTVLVHKS
ncbi:MAG TPA: hypothetical protein VG410_12560 [Solirubrobacteraceae bacterium]|jgi:hypothetical protein|nr:hypothetical protein [Solirubrobacteraceae bacterium]